MIFRRAAALALAGALAFGMAGCVGTPAAKPSTSAPAFANDEEAYKAAEKVYRDYVDAANAVDLADPKTFEPVFELTTGELNASDRKSLSNLHAEHYVMGGATVIKSFYGEKWDPVAGKVLATSCSDVHAVTLVDEQGQSKVNADRPATYHLELTFSVDRSTPDRLVISQSIATDGPGC